MSTESNKPLSVEGWEAEGARRFGPDKLKWRFVCPACKHVQSIQEMKDAGMPQGAVAFSCIGRWVGPVRKAFEKGREKRARKQREKVIKQDLSGPCDYAGGGLLCLNPIAVTDGENTAYFFDFADPEPGEPGYESDESNNKGGEDIAENNGESSTAIQGLS